MNKIAVYFAHHESLGHTTRLVNILKALRGKIKDLDIIIFHSGKRQDFFDLESYGEVVNLPYSMGKEYFSVNRLKMLSKFLRFENKEKNILKLRVKMIKKGLKKSKPDILITERFPFGDHYWDFEIPVFLKYVKTFGTKIISSIGYPSIKKTTYEDLKNFYDHIFFHCTKRDVKVYTETLKMEGASNENFLRILSHFSKSIKFTGYVADNSKLAPPEKIREKFGVLKDSEKNENEKDKLVIVSRGGGVVYPKIITASLLAAKKIQNIHFLISVGPATSNGEFDIYSKVAEKLENVTLTRHIQNFQDHLNAADLSINMCGYNTSVELMKLAKQSICAPFYTVEQKYRANLLREFNLNVIIDYKQLTCKNLISNIDEMLSNSLKPNGLSGVPFDGAEKTAKMIEGMIK